MTEKTELILHDAKLIVDWDGTHYHNKVINHLEVGFIVRISFLIPDNSNLYRLNENIFNHDSPYILIKKIQNNELLGEILNFRGNMNHNSPILYGDKIWVSRNNIIEISSLQSSNLKKFLIQEKRVSVTGPLYTVVYDDLSDESDEYYESDESDEYYESGENESFKCDSFSSDSSD